MRAVKQPLATSLSMKIKSRRRIFSDRRSVRMSPSPASQLKRASSPRILRIFPGIDFARTATIKTKAAAVAKNGMLHANWDDDSFIKRAANAGPAINPTLIASRVAPR